MKNTVYKRLYESKNQAQKRKKKLSQSSIRITNNRSNKTLRNYNKPRTNITESS